MTARYVTGPIFWIDKRILGVGKRTNIGAAAKLLTLLCIS